MSRSVANKSAPQSYWLKGCNCWAMASFDAQVCQGLNLRETTAFFCTQDQEKSLQELASFVVLKSIIEGKKNTGFFEFQIYLTKWWVCINKIPYESFLKIFLRPLFNKNCFHSQVTAKCDDRTSFIILQHTQVCLIVDKGIFTVLCWWAPVIRTSIIHRSKHGKKDNNSTRPSLWIHSHAKWHAQRELTTIRVIFILTEIFLQIIRLLECE